MNKILLAERKIWRLEDGWKNKPATINACVAGNWLNTTLTEQESELLDGPKWVYLRLRDGLYVRKDRGYLLMPCSISKSIHVIPWSPNGLTCLGCRVHDDDNLGAVLEVFGVSPIIIEPGKLKIISVSGVRKWVKSD